MKLIIFILLCIVPIFSAYTFETLGNDREVLLISNDKNRKLFINPLNGDYRISSKFGNRKHPIHGKIAFHRGVDYAAKPGTPIYAAAEGVIEYIGNNGGYGKYIRIKHKNEYSTCYAHISRFNSNLKLNSKVKQGQVIAYVGSTGAATGPHLHYEVIYKGKHIDPLTLIQ